MWRSALAQGLRRRVRANNNDTALLIVSLFWSSTAFSVPGGKSRGACHLIRLGSAKDVNSVELGTIHPSVENVSSEHI